MANRIIPLSDSLLTTLQTRTRRLLLWICGPGKQMASLLILAALRLVRRNLGLRRLFSFPHLLVVFWVVILLWGERWVFDSKVQDCAWARWEKWVSRSQARVLFCRPWLSKERWPLSSLAKHVLTT